MLAFAFWHVIAFDGTLFAIEKSENALFCSGKIRALPLTEANPYPYLRVDTRVILLFPNQGKLAHIVQGKYFSPFSKDKPCRKHKVAEYFQKQQKEFCTTCLQRNT